MSRLHPKLWLAGFVVWFLVLWWLSSIEGNGMQSADHVDKIEHFGYFLGGGGLLCGYFRRLEPGIRPGLAITVVSIVVMALLGAFDEWHQTFTPGRSGNDVYDWLADVVGSVTGIFTMNRLHRYDD